MKKRLLILAGFLCFSVTGWAVDQGNPENASDVQQRMQQLVPFSLNKTLETFTKTVHGGIQHLVAKSADDTKQIQLIQAHMKKIAEEFSKGDFSLTEQIHGYETPGLKMLKTAKTDDIRFEYKALPNGAQIHYSTEYPQYVQALHQWFDAQKNAHGSAEIPEHERHHGTPAE
jgi:hypothetical protein